MKINTIMVTIAGRPWEQIRHKVVPTMRRRYAPPRHDRGVLRSTAHQTRRRDDCAICGRIAPVVSVMPPHAVVEQRDDVGPPGHIRPSREVEQRVLRRIHLPNAKPAIVRRSCGHHDQLDTISCCAYTYRVACSRRWRIAPLQAVRDRETTVRHRVR